MECDPLSRAWTRLAGGDADAINEIVKCARPTVQRALRKVGLRGVDVEAIANAVYLDVWRAARSGCRPEHPLAWLCSVAGRRGRRHLIGEQRRESYTRGFAFTRCRGACSSCDSSEPSVDLETCLARLDRNTHLALLWRLVHCVSRTEIARRLGLTIWQVDNLLRRGRSRIRDGSHERADLRRN